MKQFIIFLLCVLTVPVVAGRYDKPLLSRDPRLEIARGMVPGQRAINKFGRAPSGAQTTATDIWDLADSSATQQIWVAPTQARIHAITSTSGFDKDPNTGAWTLQVFGLQTWDTAETSEIVALNGTAGVNTANSYVIIHRMKVLTAGSGGKNAGVIKATAATDNTVTAVVLAGNKQTLMAIYGVPSTQVAYMTGFYINLHNTANPSTAVEIVFSVWVNESPDVDEKDAAFIIKHLGGLISTAQGDLQHAYDPYKRFAGPCIIKLQCTGNVNDIDSSGGFDLILVDN